MFTGLESPTHLLLLMLIILLLFGAKRLPEMGRSLGRSIQEFKAGLSSREEFDKTEAKPPEVIEQEKEKAKTQG
ncbi:MAG: twin-arginine translocase TatA/TatE family subunit [Rubrobacter sp.]|nr:twin-arginine translocase TatA/TatE family subunit [Rubrobacter sp.]